MISYITRAFAAAVSIDFLRFGIAFLSVDIGLHESCKVDLRDSADRLQ